MEHHALLERGKYYHIFNRGIAGTNIFLEERNYAYFLNLYAKHVEPVAETFAYCLLRNHFHIFVRIKTFEVSETSKVSAQDLNPTQGFSNCFNAYAKAINKTYGRTGSLFEHRFRRLEVTAERYCLRLVHYIHYNPQKHGFVTDFREYPYSSYRAMLSDKPTKLQRVQVLDWFGGRVAFDAVHRTLSDEREIWDLISEDE
jgi:REP element-mobilizing transposase RayT